MKRLNVVGEICTLLTCCFVCILTFGCGSGGGGTTTQPPSAITSVTISPASVTVQPGVSQTFTATVAGTGSFSSAVNWSVNGKAGGDSTVGLISATGVYTAPAAIPNPSTVTAAATSTQDSTRSASSSVQIGPNSYDVTGIQISPAAATVNTSSTSYFYANVQGAGLFSNAVTWSVNNVPGGNSTVGTVTTGPAVPNGTVPAAYVAPSAVPQGGTVTLKAASAIAPGVVASAQLTVVKSTQAPPAISQLSPATADAGTTIQVTGTGFTGDGTFPTAVTFLFTAANGVTIPAPASVSNLTDTQVAVVVPLGAATGPVSVEVQNNTELPQTSAAVQFTRIPRIRIRAAHRDLSSGESTTFQWKIVAGDTTTPVTWSTTAGSIASDGTYTAPGGITSDSYALVYACLNGTTRCDIERLGLHPFQVSPQPPTVGAGQTIQLQGVQGGSLINPAFTLYGPGSITNGSYTASSKLADAGSIPFTATSNNFTESGNIEVTGQFPGTVNYVADYIVLDFYDTTQDFGTKANSLGVIGSRLYVNDDYKMGQVVDVYDITDPMHPVWTDAFEPVTSSGQISYCDGNLYEVTATDFSNGQPYTGSIGVYDLSGATPALRQKTLLGPTIYGLNSLNGCVFTEIKNGSIQVTANSTTVAAQYALKLGGVFETDYTLPIPPLADSDPDQFIFSLDSDGQRLYMSLSDSIAGNLVAYDLSTPAVTVTGITQTQNAVAFDMKIVNNLLFFSHFVAAADPITQIYDISSPVPTLVSSLPVSQALAWNNTSVLFSAPTGGIRVVDISNPQKPVLTSVIADASPTNNATFAGGYAMSAGGAAGIAIMDVSEPGGMLPAYHPIAYGTPLLTAITGDPANAFTAGPVSNTDSVLVRYDLTQSPAVQSSLVIQPNILANALAVSGTTLYEGTDNALLIFDVSSQGDPVAVSSVPLQVASLCVSGNKLIAGTIDQKLITYDITQPRSPQQIGSVTLPDVPFQITMSGNFTLVADNYSGLLIYNLTVPSSPAFVSSLISSPRTFDVAADGSLALVAAQDGLLTIDLSNPANPQLLSKTAMNNNQGFAIAFANKIAYLGINNLITVPFQNISGAVLGYDYQDPTRPRLVSMSSSGGAFISSMWMSGTPQLFAAAYTPPPDEGPVALTTFDITQPRSIISFPMPALDSSFGTGSPIPGFSHKVLTTKPTIAQVPVGMRITRLPLKFRPPPPKHP